MLKVVKKDGRTVKLPPQQALVSDVTVLLQKLQYSKLGLVVVVK